MFCKWKKGDDLTLLKGLVWKQNFNSWFFFFIDLTSKFCHIGILGNFFFLLILIFLFLKIYTSSATYGIQNINYFLLYFPLPVLARALLIWKVWACATCGGLASVHCCESLRQLKPTIQRPWVVCLLCELQESFLFCGLWSVHSLMKTHATNSWYMLAKITSVPVGLLSSWISSTSLIFLEETAM